MLLKEWRDQQRLTRRELADRLNADPMSIYRWELDRGAVEKRIPAPGFMQAIYRLTRGAVTPNDFYDLVPLEQLDLPVDLPGDAPLFAGTPQC